MKLLALILFFSQRSHASLGQLATELLKENADVIEAQGAKEKSQLDIKTLQTSRTWTLTASGTKTDAKSESATTYTSNPYELTNYTLGVQKAFEWGGTLSLNNTLSQVQSSGVERNGFSQGLSYSQDIGSNFFGATFFKDVKILEGASRATEFAQNEKIQSVLYALSQSYTNAQLNLALVELQKEAVERAVKRMELIKGRVRDGLREEVDLIQARMALLAAQEQLKSFSIAMSSALDKLAGLMHREIKENEIEILSLTKKISSVPSKTIDHNLSLQAVEEKLKIAQLQNEKNTLSFIPSITFTASVTNNDYDPTQSTAMSKGKIGEDQKDVTAMVSLAWAIGNAPQRVEEQKVQIDQQVASEKLKKLKISLQESVKELQKQIKILDETIELTSKRKDLADKALAEYTKLYRRGKADLDQVIRSEEDLINTERALVQNISQRQILAYSLATIYGSLDEFVMEKK